MGGFAHLATLVQRLRASASRRAAARRWRHAGRARRRRLWTAGPGHDRRAEAARRRDHDRRTGNSPTAPSGCKARRRKRVRRTASSSSRRTCAPPTSAIPCSSPTSCASINGVAGRDRRPGVPVHADRQSALLRAGLDLRHPGGEPAEGGRRGARGKGAQVVVAAVAQRHGRRPEARRRASRGIDAILGGHTHDARAAAGRSSTIAGGRTLVTNAGCNGKFVGVLDLDVRRRTGARLALPPAAGVRAICCRPTAAWRRSSHGARAVRSAPRRAARRHRRPAVPARQLQRHGSTS